MEFEEAYPVEAPDVIGEDRDLRRLKRFLTPFFARCMKSRSLFGHDFRVERDWAARSFGPKLRSQFAGMMSPPTYILWQRTK